MCKKGKHNKDQLKKGISVIVPSYKGEKWILKCLDSLESQTLDNRLFEIIIIINGEKDSTERLVDDFQKEHQSINIQKIVIERAGASYARNIGIENTTRRYSTFIDDDDYVSSSYLEALYKEAAQDCIVMGQITDVFTDGTENTGSAANIQIEDARNKQHIKYEDLLRPLRMNTLKLIPTTFVKSISYDVTLESGEDVVYFTELLTKFSCNIKLTEFNKAIYYRVIRSNSVSRQKVSFEFNILGRLAVIEKLNDLFCQTNEKEKHRFIKTSINAQMGFMETYLKKYPTENAAVIKKIEEHDFLYISYMERGLREKLNIYQSKAKKAQTDLDVCLTSSSYQLGHLLLHETRSIKDILYLPNRINKIRTKEKNTSNLTKINALLNTGYIYLEKNYNYQSNMNNLNIVYAIHNSLPETNNGYAIRSHYIAMSVYQADINIYPVTRVGFPLDLKTIGKYENDDFNPIVNSLPYYRMNKEGFGWGKTTIPEYLENYSEMLANFAQAREATLIHAASNYVNGLAAVNAAKLLNIPSIYEVRGFWEITGASRNPDFKNSDMFKMQKHLEIQACTDATSVIALSEIVKEELINRGINEDKIYVVPNGVDTQKMKPLEKNIELLKKFGWQEKFVVGFIGSVVDYEGLSLLIEAAEKLATNGYNDFRYMIVGDGNDLANLKKAVEEKDLSELFLFMGRVPYEDVEKYYSIMDAACYPRLNWEVCTIVSPKKPFEAMSYGIPVVSSSVRANSYFIEDGVNGLVHTCENSDSIVEKLKFLYEDDVLKQKIGSTGREWVVKNRESKVAGPKLKEIYRQTIDKFIKENKQ